jgi:hypothetical protein
MSAALDSEYKEDVAFPSSVFAIRVAGCVVFHYLSI